MEEQDYYCWGTSELVEEIMRLKAELKKLEQ